MTSKELQRESAIYLSRYQIARAEVRDIEKRIERVRSEMMGVKGISYEGGDMPKAQFRTGDLSDYIARIDDLIYDWQNARVRAIELMREISETINAIDHNQARRVLMLHFVDGYSYEDIADMIPCDVRTVFRYRAIGLRKVVIKCQ
jgi:DNA-directed RNA polymerase specialized sigma24 family protein